MLALRRGQAALVAALGDRLGPVTCMGCDASTIELGPFGMVLSGTREEGYRYDTIWRCSACGETYPYRTKGEDRLWRTWHEP